MRTAARPLLLAGVAVLLLMGACSSEGSPDATGRAVPGSSATRQTAPVHPDLRAFVAEVEEGADAAFTGTYSTLRKLGGVEATADVAVAPPRARVAVDDWVLVVGPEEATCRRSAEACVEGLREDRLAPFGLFSGFYSTGPAQAMAALGERPDAGTPTTSSRQLAGVELRCLSVPVEGQVASTWCLTPEGVVGYADTAALRVELTSYEPGPPEEPIEAPYPVVDDPSFLVE